VRVAVSAAGAVGAELVAELGRRGHEVTRLVPGGAGAGEAAWDPDAGAIDSAGLDGLDAVVHMGGVPVIDRRWSPGRKRAMLDSRLRGTGLLARTLARLPSPPAVLVSYSAVSFYGDRGDEVLTEASECGLGFLPEVAALWEGATRPAADAGIRVVNARSGVVLTPTGGVLKKLLPAFRLGLGGTVGTGRQWMSWVSVADEVAALVHILGDGALRGPVNVSSPNPVTNAEFTTTLARVLGRPAVLPVPTAALKAVFGRQMTEELLLGSQRALPAALLARGFEFTTPHLEGALRRILGR
jgi:uncharacterized protein